MHFFFLNRFFNGYRNKIRSSYSQCNAAGVWEISRWSIAWTVSRCSASKKSISLILCLRGRCLLTCCLMLCNDSRQHLECLSLPSQSSVWLISTNRIHLLRGWCWMRWLWWRCSRWFLRSRLLRRPCGSIYRFLGASSLTWLRLSDTHRSLLNRFDIRHLSSTHRLFSGLLTSWAPASRSMPLPLLIPYLIIFLLRVLCHLLELLVDPLNHLHGLSHLLL